MIDLTAKISSWPFAARLVCAFAFGGLMVAAMPPWNLWPCLFIGLGGFYVLLSAINKPVHAFGFGWLFGFSYFVFGLSWIGNALLVDGNSFVWAWPLAVAGLPVILALFPAAACALTLKFTSLKTPAGLFLFIALLSLSEWLRGHVFTGFPWNLFGYGWNANLPIMQLLSIGGVYWLTLLTCFWALIPGFIMVASRADKALKTALSFILLVTICGSYFWGAQRLAVNDVDMRSDLVIRLVQPNIPQEDKWNPQKSTENMRKFLALSHPADLNSHMNTVIIWPETSISDYVLDNEQARAAIKTTLAAYDKTAYLLTGILRYRKNPDGRMTYFNSLGVFDKQLNRIDVYDKSHLVPFGEYIPLKQFIPIKPVVQFTGFQPGGGPANIALPDIGTFSPLVCYEIIFPATTRTADNTGRPDFIVNVTNDAWYGASAGPHQHFVMARFRAIEQGIPVIRSANTGISGIIDPFGRIIYQKELGQSAGDNLFLPKKAVNTPPFDRYGNIFFFFGVAAFLGLSLLFQIATRNTSKG